MRFRNKILGWVGMTLERDNHTVYLAVSKLMTSNYVSANWSRKWRFMPKDHLYELTVHKPFTVEDSKLCGKETMVKEIDLSWKRQT